MNQIITKEVISKEGHEKIVVQIPEKWDQNERKLISTTTGELFMPARLYFRFRNKKTLMKALERRHCIELFDDGAFNISYWEEAQTIKLKVPYDEVPENVFPVLLARGSFVGQSEIHIDVRSFDRAIGVLKFLNKYIGSQFMYATHIATYNRLTSIKEQEEENALNLDYDKIFDEEKLQQIEYEQDFSKFSNNENRDSEEVAQENFEEMINRPIPVIRRTAIKNNQAVLNHLQFSLTIVQAFAKAYWDGKQDYSMADLLCELFQKNEAEEQETKDN